MKLAESLVDDFDVVELLSLLADRSVEVLGVSAAGVMLVAPEGDLRVVASSSEAMRVVELFELQADEGPCMDCFASDEAVLNQDLTTVNGRWPRFAPVAVDAGFRGVHALPMRLRGSVIGALNLPASPAGDIDLEGLTRPLLTALATIAGLETTYLTVFDWDSREQEVRFVHRAGGVAIEEGSRLPLPPEVSQESLPGVTRSPPQMPKTHPDSQAARRLGLRTYVSVPVVLAKHELFGMVCGASRRSGAVTEPVVAVMEFFAEAIADHITRERVAATEQRAAAAEEQLRARARYLAVAEHQLKTPLTSLLGAAKLLRDGWKVLDDAQREQFVDMVVRSGDDLSGRIDGLLTEARADVQSRELAPIDLDLGEFVEAITGATDGLTADHSVRAHVEAGLQLRADPAALHQVLGHLLDNAIKYSPRHAAVNVVASSTADGIVISVVDEGMGLPDGMDVFEPFKRGDEHHVASTPGIGLGLHIVRNLVEAMGGTVDAETNPWRGSTFTVRLPRREDPSYPSVSGTESSTTA